MYADLDLVRKLTHGAVAVTEKDGWFLFSRFTDEQRDTYRNIPDFYRKTFASSGIRLEFKTSSSFKSNILKEVSSIHLIPDMVRHPLSIT